MCVCPPPPACTVLHSHSHPLLLSLYPSTYLSHRSDMLQLRGQAQHLLGKLGRLGRLRCDLPPKPQALNPKL